MKVKYKITETKATPFGGLYVITEFLNQIPFHKTFADIFGRYRKVRIYLPSHNIQLAMASITAGGERLYDIERFQIDPVVRDLFDTSDIPQDTTLRDDFLAIGERDAERQELLLRLNDEFFEKCDLKRITLDIGIGYSGARSFRLTHRFPSLYILIPSFFNTGVQRCLPIDPSYRSPGRSHKMILK